MRTTKKVIWMMLAILLSATSTQANWINARPETVKKFFEMHGAPILAEIARCESEFRHRDNDGQVLKNPRSSATGVMQITTYWHQEYAAELGLDLYHFRDNMLYALHLYRKEGTKPWKASRKCWQRAAGSG